VDGAADVDPPAFRQLERFRAHGDKGIGLSLRFPKAQDGREGDGMFERFTDRARRVVVLAQVESRTLDHNYIGTEHILLGLIHEGGGVAARALESLGIDLDAVRFQVEEIIGRGEATPTGHIPFTPRAKKVLELALREARQLGHDYIGTEHILLGMIREGEGVAAQVLEKLGADLGSVRFATIDLLSAMGVGAEPSAPIQSPRPDPETGFRSTPSQWETPEARRMARERRMERIEALAQEEADDLGHRVTGAPHRWLGFVRLQIEEAEQDLRSLQASLDEGRLRVAEQWSDAEPDERSGPTG
jgi:hypothetical protein